MILTRLFKHFKINLSDERSITPSINISRTLLKRMHVGLRAQALPYPTSPPAQSFASGSSSSAADPYAGIMTQLGVLSLSITSSTEKILANQEALRSEQQNNMACVALPSDIFKGALTIIFPGMIGMFQFLILMVSLFLRLVLHLILELLLRISP